MERRARQVVDVVFTVDQHRICPRLLTHAGQTLVVVEEEFRLQRDRVVVEELPPIHGAANLSRIQAMKLPARLLPS